MSAINIDHVDIIFGKEPKKALALSDQGFDQAGIKERCGQHIAVQSVSLAIEKGELFVVMGLSGSGKSTLLRSINGLIKLSRGEISITIEGRTVNLSLVKDQELRTLRKHHIAMVFQNFALLPWRTVRQNVALGLELAGVNKETMALRVDEVLDKVFLKKWQDKRPSELSGGMQQRVGLARALAQDPEILLMDEPFSALDPLIRSELADELVRLQHELKKTIVFVSHDLSEAARIGSRIAIMNQGRVEQVGSFSDIANKPANEFIKRFVTVAKVQFSLP